MYFFFFFSLIGEQFLDPTQEYADHNIDIYVPFFAFLQLFFYVSWLKVAEALLNPFGADDHDFEFVPMLTRHLEVSVMAAVLKPRYIFSFVLFLMKKQLKNILSILFFNA